MLTSTVQRGKDYVRLGPSLPHLGAEFPATVGVDVGEGETGAAFGEEEGDGLSDGGGAAAIGREMSVY